MINFKEDLLFKAKFSNTFQSRDLLDLLRLDKQKVMPYQDDPRQAQGGGGYWHLEIGYRYAFMCHFEVL